MPSSNEPRRFVILAAPRTGSNALCSLLQSHPDVLCHHEIFNPAAAFYALPLRDGEFSLGDLQEREADPLAYMARIWREHLGHRAVGFKMTHRQNKAVFEALCADGGISKIILRRRHRLRTYVSRLLAEQSGVWEAYGAATERPASNKVSVDYKELLQAVAYNDAYYDELNSRVHGPCAAIEYENMFDADEQSSLLDFLGLRRLPLQTRSRRQNPQPLASLLENAEELARQLQKAPETRALYEELNESLHAR